MANNRIPDDDLSNFDFNLDTSFFENVNSDFSNADFENNFSDTSFEMEELFSPKDLKEITPTFENSDNAIDKRLSDPTLKNDTGSNLDLGQTLNSFTVDPSAISDEILFDLGNDLSLYLQNNNKVFDLNVSEKNNVNDTSTTLQNNTIPSTNHIKPYTTDEMESYFASLSMRDETIILLSPQADIRSKLKKIAYCINKNALAHQPNVTKILFSPVIALSNSLSFTQFLNVAFKMIVEFKAFKQNDFKLLMAAAIYSDNHFFSVLFNVEYNNNQFKVSFGIINTYKDKVYTDIILEMQNSLKLVIGQQKEISMMTPVIIDSNIQNKLNDITSCGPLTLCVIKRFLESGVMLSLKELSEHIKIIGHLVNEQLLRINEYNQINPLPTTTTFSNHAVYNQSEPKPVSSSRNIKTKSLANKHSNNNVNAPLSSKNNHSTNLLLSRPNPVPNTNINMSEINSSNKRSWDQMDSNTSMYTMDEVGAHLNALSGKFPASVIVGFPPNQIINKIKFVTKSNDGVCNIRLIVSYEFNKNEAPLNYFKSLLQVVQDFKNKNIQNYRMFIAGVFCFEGIFFNVLLSFEVTNNTFKVNHRSISTNKSTCIVPLVDQAINMIINNLAQHYLGPSISSSTYNDNLYGNIYCHSGPASIMFIKYFLTKSVFPPVEFITFVRDEIVKVRQSQAELFAQGPEKKAKVESSYAKESSTKSKAIQNSSKALTPTIPNSPGLFATPNPSTKTQTYLLSTPLHEFDSKYGIPAKMFESKELSDYLFDKISKNPILAREKLVIKRIFGESPVTTINPSASSFCRYVNLINDTNLLNEIMNDPVLLSNNSKDEVDYLKSSLRNLKYQANLKK